MSSIDIKNFKKHRPVDPSDPGFTIPGAKLRWISGRVRERSGTDIWKQLRKSDMPKDLVEHIENHYPGAFSNGDTVRRGNGELILAYASVERVESHRRSIDQDTRDQASRSKIMPNMTDVGHKNDFAKIEQYEKTASTIPSGFLKKQNAE